MPENQISRKYRYIENTCILAILQIWNGYLQHIVIFNIVSNRRPEKCGFGKIKRQIHRLRFTLLSCDKNRISQVFHVSKSSDMLEVSKVLNSNKLPKSKLYKHSYPFGDQEYIIAVPEIKCDLINFWFKYKTFFEFQEDLLFRFSFIV